MISSRNGIVILGMYRKEKEMQADMKKWIFTSICTLLFTAGGAVLAESPDSIQLIMNGKEIPTDVAPLLIDGRIMVPIRVVSESLGASVTWDKEKKRVIIDQPRHLQPIASLSGDQTILYALQEKDGVYSPLLVEHEGQFAVFNWNNVTNPTYKPQILSQDLTGDGANEIMIILTTGYGTGAKTEEPHILLDMKEIPIADPLESIKKRVQSRVTAEQVVISIDNETITIPRNEIPVDPSMIFRSLGTGSIITFDLQGNGLRSHIPAQLSPAHFLGEFVLTYQFMKDRFEVSTIEFVRNK